MGDFSLVGGASDCLEAGFDYSNTRGTAVTTGGSVNTTGSYVELLSAANNNRPITGVYIVISPAGGQGDLMFNLALGASGSEVDVISNIFVPDTNSLVGKSNHTFHFPVCLPAGERISINAQGEASSTNYVHLQLVRGNINDVVQCGAVDTIGADTATTDGVTVSAAGTVNTFGSWTEIVASTTEAYRGFVVATHKISGSMTTMHETYQIAVGSAGNEEIIYSGALVGPGDNERVVGTPSPFIPVGIPEGARVSARVQADSTDADANLDFIIYGVR